MKRLPTILVALTVGLPGACDSAGVLTARTEIRREVGGANVSTYADEVQHILVGFVYFCLASIPLVKFILWGRKLKKMKTELDKIGKRLEESKPQSMG